LGFWITAGGCRWRWSETETAAARVWRQRLLRSEGRAERDQRV
jgi:hypothetical protein